MARKIQTRTLGDIPTGSRRRKVEAGSLLSAPASPEIKTDEGGAVKKEETRTSVRTVPNENPVTGHRWGWYLLSLIVPFAGIFVGLFLYDMENRDIRRVGRNSLLIGFAFWVLFPAMIFLALLFLGTITVVDWVSRFAPTL